MNTHFIRFTPQLAAILFGSYFAFGVVIQPLAEMCRDRFGSRFTMALIAGAFLMGLAALQFGTSPIHIVLLTALLSHRNGLGVVTNTFIADTLNDDIT